MPTIDTRPIGDDVKGYSTLGTASRQSGRLTREVLDPLVMAAKAGDPGAVHALLAVVKPVLVRYCRARMGGRDLSYLSADDIAQEACLAVFKMLPSYEDRGGSFLYLVRAIAANKVADAFRVVSRDRSDPVPELPEAGSVRNEPESHLLGVDLGARLGRLVATLPRTQREVITLRIVVGLTATETGVALGLTPGNVRVKQHRALVKLRELVQEEDDL
ncbi:RNA polymerase sigma factor ShbA [Amycolatopsis sp. BJA-103]|uniref:RNA polymerase sigma factor ShbA n=1 Tax=Amycolatopsis sp. BJA-103 TaxID=1911175 RepID=UPI000C758396|nr:RNA polymerase sigma factor ShbA [Amycolatopsis sp. BJA-103]AUI58177.1 RNA polymerase subunit sigma [Amycolatopsis sp. BJA-103]PNE13191.1 RNA polymerase subunit sigma [Amycolatopsis sp. BJA-103]